MFYGEKILPDKTLIFFDEIVAHFNSNERMDRSTHEVCLKLYRTYLITGGMPEVVKNYLDEKKVIATLDVQAMILETRYDEVCRSFGIH